MLHSTSPRLVGILATLLSLSLTSTVAARPAHKQALADYFGPFLARKLHDCQTCHVPEKPGDKADLEADKPHNPFGARLAAVRGELKKAGKKIDITSRLDAILDEDSDGDGVPNIIELLAGRFPGDPNDKPTEAEIVEARKTYNAWLKYRSSYPWRPFEVVKRPALPSVKNAGWMRNPIDAFIAAAQEEKGLKPRPEAPKLLLLRRVYLDLVGLVPTPEEIEQALNDSSPEWYEKVVDRLLNSPRYGERWGRHWMDVWRYSDWAGWTGGGQIRDELAPDDPDVLRATGYLVRNYKMLSREKWLQDTVDHTFMAFQGVTIGCAKCHDHMYDPIHQKEYYQLRAIFEPHQVRIDAIPGQPDTKKDGLVHVYDATLDVPTYFYVRGDERTPDKSAPMQPGVPEALGGRFPKIDAVKLPSYAYSPEKRVFVIKETLAAAGASIAQARAALAAPTRNVTVAIAGLLSDQPLCVAGCLTAARKPLDAMTLAELDVELAEVKHQSLLLVLRAEKLEDAGKKSSEDWKTAATEAGTSQRSLAVIEAKRNVMAARVDPRVAKNPQILDQALAKAIEAEKRPAGPNYTPRQIKSYPQTSTGRRLAFARWIADTENPLTARVAMNHIWMRHFGQPIVPRVFDFGRNGQRPTHPALLDWLAAEFMDRGWSMKAMHKLIVTSNTYRLASTSDPENLAIDRDNQYYWRMSSRRLEAELVRDNIFHVAGKLDLTMGGADIDHAQGLTLPRRSIYFRHAQEKQMEFLKIFDCAAVTECYQRKESVLPQQALALANSELTLTHSRIIAKSLTARHADPESFVRAAFMQVLARNPTPEEIAECTAFLKEQSEKRSATPQAADVPLRARENLVHVLMNHHDFVTIR
jgi:hypothetical protein